MTPCNVIELVLLASLSASVAGVRLWAIHPTGYEICATHLDNLDSHRRLSFEGDVWRGGLATGDSLAATLRTRGGEGRRCERNSRVRLEIGDEIRYRLEFESEDGRVNRSEVTKKTVQASDIIVAYFDFDSTSTPSPPTSSPPTTVSRTQPAAFHRESSYVPTTPKTTPTCICCHRHHHCGHHEEETSSSSSSSCERDANRLRGEVDQLRSLAMAAKDEGEKLSRRAEAAERAAESARAEFDALIEVADRLNADHSEGNFLVVSTRTGPGFGAQDPTLFLHDFLADKLELHRPEDFIVRSAERTPGGGIKFELNTHKQKLLVLVRARTRLRGSRFAVESVRNSDRDSSGVTAATTARPKPGVSTHWKSGVVDSITSYNESNREVEKERVWS